MSIVASYVKAAGATLDFRIDWSTWLGPDTIATGAGNSVWTVPTGITKVSDTHDGTMTTVWLSGGTAGQSYVLTNTIITAGGRTDTRQIVIAVDPTRLGMANLINKIRSLCLADTSDYIVAGVAYFSDQQIQDELDACVQIWHFQQMDPTPEYLSGSTIYKQYTIPPWIAEWIEEDGGGTGGWAIKDGSGNLKVINTDYTVNYRSGLVIFATDQKNARNWLDCRAYDLYRAAAAIWRQKAGMEMRSIDWSNNGVAIKGSQRRDYCMTMAEEMDRKSGIQVGTMYRSDEVYHNDGIQSRPTMWNSDEPL